MRLATLIPIAALAGASLISACSSDDTSAATDASGALEAHLQCVNTEIDYMDGLAMILTEAGIQVVLESSIPSGLGIGDNMITIAVFDTVGAALPDAMIQKAETWQHIHDHGAGVQAVVTPLGDGRFTIASLCVVHRGSWEFRIDVMNDGATERVVFHFCVTAEAPNECAAEEASTDGHEH